MISPNQPLSLFKESTIAVFFSKKSFILYIRVFFPYICLCTVRFPSAQGGQKRMLGVGPCSLGRAISALTTESCSKPLPQSYATPNRVSISIDLPILALLH